jgi:RimJ/RimL family protein N-acetyltransferase
MDDHPSLFVGKRLRLAAPRSEDAEIIARWTEDSDFLRNADTDVARPHSPEEVARGFTSTARSFEFHLRTLEDDRLIGFVSIENIEWNNQCGELSIGIGQSEDRGQGYGSEALELILRYAFEELNLYRVGLDVIANNERAVHTYEKIGFQVEGHKRQAVYRDGVRNDRLVMGILLPEWQKRKNKSQS